MAPDDLSNLEKLFRQHYAELCDFAFRYVRTEAQAEEIVQDVFLAVWVKRKEITPVTTMRAYLFGAVRNRALHTTRRSAVELRFAESERLAPQHDQPHSDDRVDDLDSAVAALPERTRLAITLRWLRQMSHAEVAEAMGISVKGVEKLLTNGMKILKGRMIS